MSLIPFLGRLSQVDCEFEVILVYGARSRKKDYTEKPCPKDKTKQKTNQQKQNKPRNPTNQNTPVTKSSSMLIEMKDQLTLVKLSD